jgi:hypothetical protein
VRRGEWVGACQRDTTHRYGFLLDGREELDDALQDFFEAHVLEAFPLGSCAFPSPHPLVPHRAAAAQRPLTS